MCEEGSGKRLEREAWRELCQDEGGAEVSAPSAVVSYHLPCAIKVKVPVVV